ncbi:MAG: 3-dehydroquinate synthase, partial [Planctomycetota bacterium]
MANPTTTIEVNTASAPRTCRVVVGSQILAQSLHGCGASFMVADKHVMRLHGERLGDLAQTPGIELDQGEGTKSFRHLESILDRLAECGADRSSTALAFGGGVTCDIAGLAAALYMRGIPWIAAPTTLLAQVDASVGGKTAINLGAGKNLVGAFHQPDLVIADVALLKTLEKSELVSGLGEV